TKPIRCVSIPTQWAPGATRFGIGCSLSSDESSVHGWRTGLLSCSPVRFECQECFSSGCFSTLRKFHASRQNVAVSGASFVGPADGDGDGCFDGDALGDANDRRGGIADGDGEGETDGDGEGLSTSSSVKSSSLFSTFGSKNSPFPLKNLPRLCGASRMYSP